MAKFCQSCGKQIDDAAQACDGCGAAQGAAQYQSAGTPPPPPNDMAQEVFTPEDIEKNKIMSALAYVLFFLPLVACPESRFGRYHANQGLLLLIVGIAGGIILGIIPIIGWILLPFFYIATFVFAIIGFINGLNGRAKPLPLFGKFKIIK